MKAWRKAIFQVAILVAIAAGVAPSVAAQSAELEAFRQQVLATHNALRARHGAQPLALDAGLNDIAQDWAQQLARMGRMAHRPNNRYGENVFVAWGSQRQFDVNGVRPVQSWYDEVKYYDFNNPGFAMQTGHFTQVVWQGSTRLGCGKAQAGDGKIYVVCNYDPPGNYRGQFPQNVQPAGQIGARAPAVQQPQSTQNEPDTQDGDLESFRQQALNAHNALRARHGAAPLVQDAALNNLAQEWAQHMASTGQMRHRANSGFGENIHVAWTTQGRFDIPGARPVQSWYDEVKRYDFNNPGFSIQTGHFTQVVWQGSTKLGCGKANSRDGRIYIVCNYDPPGNYRGQFPQNVQPAVQGGVRAPAVQQPQSTQNEQDTQGGDLEPFRQQALNTHNALRARHGAGALALDARLNDLAQDWARQLAASGRMAHRANSGVGENVFVAWGSQRQFDVSGARPVQSWYDEVKYYDFNNPGFSMQTGHFTQVVWKGSTRLGCGKAQAGDGKIFVVCNYDPPGNFQGRFPQNVDPAR